MRPVKSEKAKFYSLDVRTKNDQHFYYIFVLYFDSKSAPQAKFLDFDNKKFQMGNFLSGGNRGIRRRLILKIKIFLRGEEEVHTPKIFACGALLGLKNETENIKEVLRRLEKCD